MILFLVAACGAPSEADLDGTRGGRVDVFFNAPGTRPDNQWYPDMVAQMVSMIDGANASIDFAVMGFSQPDLLAAFERAYWRGIALRMVGDSGHLTNAGYALMRRLHVPMSVGNSQHIMHDKFMVVDSRFVFASTANWEISDLQRNVNNGVVIDQPNLAADFTAEFDQMFAGSFGASKVEIDNGRRYEIGDTTVELWFSPNEDAMGRILERVDEAEQSVRFMIFAFTKDQLGSLLVRKHEQGTDVQGVIDQSQLHSNGQYHEVYRMLASGIPLRLDADDNTTLPGDYQAGGGRLHAKTLILDAEADAEAPAVLTGSFNWSASATQSNDEVLLVIESPRIAADYANYWDELWMNARPLGYDRVADGDVAPGDVVINEVMWYGVNEGDADGVDEFIELRNTTGGPVDLSMWQIANPNDFVVGLPPGSVIPANGLFTILDHTLEAYQDGVPQDSVSAFRGGDLVLNPFNDNRAARLYLKDDVFSLRLQDPDAVIVDVAGDGGAAFAGGPDGSRSRSMERDDDPGDGATPQAWHACSLDEGGANVNDAYKNEVIATPGEANSAP